MTLIQIITAYIALERLCSQPLPFSSAHKLMLLRRQLAPHYEFFAQQENSLVLRYAAQDKAGNPIIDENGGFTLRDPAESSLYTCDRLALNAVNVDEKFEKIRLAVPDSFCVTLPELEALSEFIDFEGVE